jgi:hypothetical protein
MPTKAKLEQEAFTTMSKYSICASILFGICASVASPIASAQGDEDFFVRNKYEAVTDRAQPEFDPLPIDLGGFEATPELGFAAGFTSNLFALSENEIDDTFVGFAPRVSVDSKWGRHALGFSAVVDHLEYSDTSSESRTNINLQGNARIDVSSGVFLFGGVQFDDLTEPRSNIASVQGADEPVENTRAGVEAGLQYEAGRIRVRGAVGLETFDFDDIELSNGLIQDQDFRDRDRTTINARVSYAVERDWALFAEAVHSQSDYDPPNIFNAFNRDFDTTTLRVGTDFELASLLRGDIGVGYLQSEYDDPSFTDVDGLSIDGNLQWFVSQLTTISAAARRSVIDPGLATTSAAIDSGVSVRADHELRRNVIINGQVRFTNFDFENIDRDDDRYSVGAGATWKLNPNIWIDGSYEYTDQSSNVQDFSENRFLIGFRIFP